MHVALKLRFRIEILVVTLVLLPSWGCSGGSSTKPPVVDTGSVKTAIIVNAMEEAPFLCLAGLERGGLNPTATFSATDCVIPKVSASNSTTLIGPARTVIQGGSSALLGQHIGRLVTAQSLPSDLVIRQATILENKKIILLARSGLRTPASNLVRVNADGSLDSTFGVNGFLGINTSQNPQLLSDSTNRILIADTQGTDVDPNTGLRTSTVLVTRYLEDGSTDLSFGVGGTFRYSETLGKKGVLAIGDFRKDLNNNILVMTYFWASGTEYSNAHLVPFPTGTLIKLSPNGQRDSGFGNNGISHPFNFAPYAGNTNSSAYTTAFGFGPLKDGKILVWGATPITVTMKDGRTRPSIGLLVTKLEANGTHDLSYGENGVGVYGEIELPTTERVSNPSVSFDGEGSLVYLSMHSVGKIHPDGKVDITFGNLGTVDIDSAVVAAGSSGGVPTTVILLPNHSVLVGGSFQTTRPVCAATVVSSSEISGYSSAWDFGFVHLGSKGQVDLSFGTRGLLLSDLGGDDSFYGMNLIGSNSIFAYGYIDMQRAGRCYRAGGPV